METRESGHANAAKSATFVDARPLVLARVRFALIDVHLAATSLEPGQAVASVRARHVNAGPAVFTRRALIAFVDVNVTFGTNVAARATASVTTVDHARFTDGSRVARIGITSIVQVTKEASLVRRTFANVASHPVVACIAVETGLNSAVIHIDLAIVTLESVDTDAGVTSVRVVTRGSVLAYVRPRLALVDVLRAVASAVLSGAGARVSAYSVNATASVLA